MNALNKYRHILIFLLLFALVFLLFGETVKHGFNSDDYLVLYYAQYKAISSPAEGLAVFVSPSWGIFYRPIIRLILEGMARTFGVSAGKYHIASLICYSLLCFEVYLLGLVLTGRMREAIVAALIFVTANVHAQAIFWISNINAVLVSILMLASFIFFASWHKNLKRLFYFSSILFFVLALFTKESAVTLPVILILYTFLLGGEIRFPEAVKRAVQNCWPFIILAASFVLIRSLVMSQIDLPPSLTSFNIRTFMLGLLYSLIMTLSPLDWALVIHWLNKLGTSGPTLPLLASMVVIITVAVPMILRRYRAVFLLLWIVSSAGPMLALGLVPSERHVVFGSAAGAILIAVALFKLSELAERKTSLPAVAFACIFVISFAGTSLYFLKQRQVIWRNASHVAGAIVKQTITMHPMPERDSSIFFLNVPDSLDGAFIFRFENLAYALRTFYKNEDLEVVRVVTLDKLSFDALTSRESAYFKLGAMGGHLYLPENYSEMDWSAKRWDRLKELGVVKKNTQYLEKHKRYGGSPLFIYSDNSLAMAPPEELKKLLENLYSLD